MLIPNLWRSEGRRPSHMMLGTVRLRASKDMACGEKSAHMHTETPRKSHTHKQKMLSCA